MAAAAVIYYYCFSSDKNAPLYYSYKYIFLYVYKILYCRRAAASAQFGNRSRRRPFLCFRII